ncbi:hypothetical protein S40285_02482 [Stachybotrys chlorohalonatus IBT 40285]|uniref:Arrestin-like N-terminal domain-containing protein n=1 Tax=Stachybotrys chlorohalonatus (strain IBT 40285) TaxID=1283841 RepID=A0A084QWQ0_STAC4|nr:hypothetical protein S40285_02482 [Stachybotrys chlorohalonata IBT 40285]
MGCFKFTQTRAKGQVLIHIDGHHPNKTYTTGCLVSGEVSITPLEDIYAPSVQISLNGTAYTQVDAVPTPTVTKHAFLKMEVPEGYPEKLFEAGQEYIVPFEFVIPERIPVGESSLNPTTAAVKAYHERLPPTMGRWNKNDMSPGSTQIKYEVEAAVVRDMGSSPDKHLHASQLIKVMPAIPEDPPASIDSTDVLYALQKTKSLRERLFKKYGAITATLSPPGALSVDPGTSRFNTDTSVVLDIEYTPLNLGGQEEIPTLESVTGKLEARSWFSSTEMTKLPDRGTSSDGIHPRQACFSASYPLLPIALNQAQCQLVEDSHSSVAGRFQTSLKIPIRLPPMDAVILPTFYSKLIARTYTLHLTAVVRGVKLHLYAPIQVATEPLY